MSAESGKSADDSQNQSHGAEPKGTNEPTRKVKKTMLEGQLPPQSELESATQDAAEQSSDRKVAKTMIELSMPTRDEIEAASKSAEQSQRSVPKTMVEFERPNLDAQTKQDNSSSTAPLSTADDTKRSVPKTMMEISRTELEKQIESEAQTPQPARKVSKTMMEVSLPNQSDTLKMVRKVAKTRLDSKSLDAIGSATKEPTSTTLKVCKTLTGEQSLPLLPSDKLTQSPTSQSEEEEEVVIKQERFVAKTMLDHSVLSEQLVKSHEKEKMRAAYLAQERANEPQKEFHEVEAKKNATPCSWEWTESGVTRGRVRACDKCQTKVYDFTGMEMPEAEALIFKHESRKKFKLYKRQDGKFMTQDCPVQAQKKRNFVLLVFAAVIVVVVAVACMLLAPPPAKPPEQAQHSNTDNPESSTGSVQSSGSSESTGTASTLTKPDKDGVMHFEAGEAPAPTPQSNGFFTSVGGDLPSKSGQSKQTGAPGSETNPAKTSTSSEAADSKYWDN